MRRTFQIFVLFFLFFGSFSFSQTLSGIVKDSATKEPLQGVHIISSGIKHSTISDETGRYSADLKLRDELVEMRSADQMYRGGNGEANWTKQDS